MTTDLQSQPSPRWILLAPTPSLGAWRETIANATHQAGLVFIDAYPCGPAFIPEGVAPERAVILTGDPALVSAVALLQVVILTPDAGQTPEATAVDYHLPAPQDLWLGSRLLADMAVLARTHRTIGFADMSRSRSVSLFQDLVVTAPVQSGRDLESGSQQDIREAFALYREGALSEGVNARWSPSLFSYDARSTSTSDSMVDITGRPRTLVWGPYITLPPGLWQATLRFSVDTAAAFRTFRLDWGPAADFTTTNVMPGRAGVYEISLECRFDQPSPAQVRIVLMEGAFEGGLSFLGSVVTLVGQSHDRSLDVAA